MRGLDLVVIGGGPAGSTAAAMAAKAGLDVALLEAGMHPRPQVGESLLPGIIPILDDLGLLEEVESTFCRKTGSTHVNWGQTPRWDLWFEDSDAYDHAWFVDRAHFDRMLFDAAAAAGARTYPNTPVRELLWKAGRLVGVSTADETYHAPLVVDASGQAALIARQLGLRQAIPGLDHQAAWAHWENAGRLPSPRQAQAFFVAQKDHWLWFFPLPGGRASVGLVCLNRVIKGSPAELDRFYEDRVRKCPEIWDLLRPAGRRATPVRWKRDWSYRVERVAGPGWVLCGDASGFVDPVLSQGVFLAMHAGWNVARLATAVLSDPSAEMEALESYQRSHRELFQDLLQLVRFYYQQNVSRDDYFWESKRILGDLAGRLQPRKAFVLLTSGLVRNLALDDHRGDVVAARVAKVSERTSATLSEQDCDHLDFLCLHVRATVDSEEVDLYFVVEPKDPASPTLFSTTNWYVNCIAPRLGNDPISHPSLADPLKRVGTTVRRLDDLEGEPLAAFWRRRRRDLLKAVSREFHFVRAFGE